MTIDTGVPSAPAAPDLVAASDDGTSNTDNITTVTQPGFRGVALQREAGALIRLFADTQLVG